ncbi:DUF4383 domain-containing protein [Microbacterium sp.]|uniref:DUF4383 domain-containing protein n=1 Tax=Microbacterium sp. TaxID=51671 RepID=UPI0026370F2E|nr:DUF4383 domain-containing protein [Microbacterium sp.]
MTGDIVRSYAASAIQKTSVAMGVVFILVSVAGFIPGLTHSAEHLQAAGPGSEALLLGVFQVSVLHNIVHFAYGVWGLVAAVNASASRLFLVLGGLVYLVLWVYGLIAVGNDQLNFIPLNDADNWLHLGLAIVMVALGIIMRSEPRMRPRTTGTHPVV